MTERSFPLPSQLAAVPGAEGWEAMYPYFSRFQPEDDQRFWFYNSMHFPEPMPRVRHASPRRSAYIALGREHRPACFCLPTTHGHRLPHHQRPGLHRRQPGAHRGRAERSASPTSSSARSTTTSNWERLYGAVAAAHRGADRRRSRRCRGARTAATSSRSRSCTAGRGCRLEPLPARELPAAARGYYRMWHHHFEFLLLGYGAYMTSSTSARRPSPRSATRPSPRMVAGMDAEMFRPDDELKRLAAPAPSSSASTTMFVEGADRPRCSPRSPSAATPATAGWPRSRPAKDPWFNVSVGDGFYHYHRRWNDDLTLPFAALPGYIEQIAAGEDLDRPDRAAGRAERERIVADYRDLLGTDDETGRLRPDDRPRRTGLPLRRGPQVLLRALVHHPVLQQDPRVRRAAGRAAASSPTARTSSTSRTRARGRARRPDARPGRSGAPPRGPGHWPPIVAERKRDRRGVGLARRRPRSARCPR